MRSNRKKGIFIRMIAAFLCLTFLYGGSAWTAYGAEATGALQLNNAVPGMEIRLYQIRESEYPLDFEMNTSEEMSRTAAALAAYITKQQPEPYAVKVADESGSVRYEGLASGLYLALAADMKTEDGVIIASPILIYIEDKEVVVEMKTEVRKDYDKVSVRKIWKNDSEASRPKSIEVELLQDGAVVDTVTLDKGNHWKYYWEDLQKGHTYKVVEKDVPAGYTTAVEEESAAFRIYNTKRETPPGSDKPKPGGKLPQTGQLWWPVCILAALGIILLAVGAAIRSGRSD